MLSMPFSFLFKYLMLLQLLLSLLSTSITFECKQCSVSKIPVINQIQIERCLGDDDADKTLTKTTTTKTLMMRVFRQNDGSEAVRAVSKRS